MDPVGPGGHSDVQTVIDDQAHPRRQNTFYLPGQIIKFSGREILLPQLEVVGARHTGSQIYQGPAAP
ncbi:hypothetical protein MTHERMOG20_17730 [Moorella thermoacetica]|nr:hypothetical protein MTHERMOG20_17730 [Moorella thermoacetica]